MNGHVGCSRDFSTEHTRVITRDIVNLQIDVHILEVIHAYLIHGSNKSRNTQIVCLNNHGGVIGSVIHVNKSTITFGSNLKSTKKASKPDCCLTTLSNLVAVSSIFIMLFA